MQGPIRNRPAPASFRFHTTFQFSMGPQICASCGGQKRAGSVHTTGVHIFFGDEEKLDLATRPAKLYSTTPALFRLLPIMKQD